MTVKKSKVCIIGSGIAGIASAIRLANAGYDITVYEANSYPGGKLSEIQQEGYRFDAGPSLFTLPTLVDELFKICGKNPVDFFKYKKLPFTCKYHYEDGTVIDGYADPTVFAEEVASKTNEDKDAILKALDKSATLYSLLSELFMYRSLHDWKTFVNRKALKAYLNLHKFNFFRSMHQANSSQFSDPRVIQLFNRYATYNGSNPYEAPATLNIIPHLEFNIGAYFPEEGMHSITLNLVALAKSIGVTFHFQQPVSSIVVEKGKAIAVAVEGKSVCYDVIISNMDVVNTYTRLLPDQPAPKKILSQPKSSSALIFYWGIKRQFEALDLHNIFFSIDYEKEFSAIFQDKTIADDPTVYINITSKYKPDDAPEGCENWFTMINVPNNTGQDWDMLIKKAKKNILRKISSVLKEDIEGLIATEAVLDPRTIESKTSSSLGALYGNSSNNKFAAFLRHANYSSKIKHLYFCGGSVHPGGGIPLSLLSAKIVADLIEKKG